MDSGKQEKPSGREIYEASLSGAQNRPYIPRLRSDPSPYHPLARSLDEFRREEGYEERERRLHELWTRLAHPHKERFPPFISPFSSTTASTAPAAKDGTLTPERADELGKMYHDELLKRCAEEDGKPFGPVTWKDFRKYADYKEAGKYRPFYPYYGYERVELIWNFQSCGTYFMTSLIWTVTVT